MSFSLPLTGCADKIVAPVKPPPERLQCVAAGDRPAVPAEYVIDWSKVATVDQARAEHMKFVASVRTREGIVTGYILRIEGKLWTCSSNAEWLRDFYGALPG